MNPEYPYSALTALLTIVRKEVIRVLRIWAQTLLPPVITTTLYYVIFGKLIGSRIGQIGGFDYMQFIVPGLIMMSVITNSFSNVVSSFFSAKFQRNIDELLVAPVSEHVIIIGFCTGGILRGVFIALLVTLVSLFFIPLQIAHPGIIVLVALFTASLFSLGGLINALYARKFDDVSIFPTFILSPLTYLGGVFYSIDLLPEFWRTVSLANPVLYMVNTFRYGFLGISDINSEISLLVLAAVNVLAYLLAWRLLHKKLGQRL